MRIMRPYPFLKRVAGRWQVLRCWNVHPSINQNMAGNPDNSLICADSGARRHCWDRFCRHVSTDDSIITARKLQYLRASMPTRGGIPLILSQTSQKHNLPFSLRISLCAEFHTHNRTKFATVKGWKSRETLLARWCGNCARNRASRKPHWWPN